MSWNWIGATVGSLGIMISAVQSTAAKAPIYSCEAMKKRIGEQLTDTKMFARLDYDRQGNNFYEVKNIVGIEILVRCDDGRFTSFEARLRQDGGGGSIDVINRQRWMKLHAALARAVDPQMRGIEIVSKTDRMVVDATTEFKSQKDSGAKEPKGYTARAFGRYVMSSEIGLDRIALSAWLADDELQ